MTTTAVPERVRWAIEMLAVDPGDRILEIGCARGVALALIGERLRSGRITGVDRSRVAIAAATARTRALVRAGRVHLHTSALADATLEGPFDKVFAINVNVFWLKPARELAVIRGVLARRGRLYLFYEPPSPSQRKRLIDTCTAFLEDARFTVTQVLSASARGIGLIAAPAPTSRRTD